jgi:hypothetical protein
VCEMSHIGFSYHTMICCIFFNKGFNACLKSANSFHLFTFVLYLSLGCEKKLYREV